MTLAIGKAALVATADELWDYSTQACWGGDCRPSYKGGWGRLNIDRLTDITIDTVFENEGTALVQGQTVTVASSLVVDDPSRDVLIVLAWTDAPDEDALVNDLDLTVKGEFHSVTTSYYDFYGNNFSENISGIDDGYSHAFQVGGGSSSFGSGYTKVVDEKNNVEAVFISAATLAAWPGGVNITDILVTAQDIGALDPLTQDFSLFAYNLVPEP